MAGRGRRDGAGKGWGRGPGGPGAHPELAEGVEVARGGLAAAESMAVVLRSSKGISDGGGFSGRLGSVPRT
jgi:hypothetical protein